MPTRIGCEWVATRELLCVSPTAVLKVIWTPTYSNPQARSVIDRSVVLELSEQPRSSHKSRGASNGHGDRIRFKELPKCDIVELLGKPSVWCTTNESNTLAAVQSGLHLREPYASNEVQSIKIPVSPR